MALRRFTEDVNVVSALPDVPSPPEYNASILKAKFDEAAVKIKAYLNGTLLPDIESGAAGTQTVRRLLASFTQPGSYVFNTLSYPSVGGVYDIVLVGGGGGGSANVNPTLNLNTGGGAGAVTKAFGVTLEDGTYNVTVGAAGRGGITAGVGGGATILSADGGAALLTAGGGGASSQSSMTGMGGGVGGGDSFNGSGENEGHGGDNEFGRGVRAIGLNEATVPAEGYGAGGWAGFPPTGGAVFIYGYERM